MFNKSFKQIDFKMLTGLAAVLLLCGMLNFISWKLDPTVSRDGCQYIHFARIWYDTGDFRNLFYESYHFWTPPPLFIFLMKSLMQLGLSVEAAGIGLNMVLGTFMPLIVYGIAYEITQRKDIAICSAFLIAVNPSVNELSHEIQRDMVYLFFIGLVMWLLAAGIRRQKWICWCGAGFFCGCAVLTRFETAEFFVIVPFLLVFLWLAKYRTLKMCLCHGSIFAVSLAIATLSVAVLTQTQDYIFLRYQKYFRGKMLKIEQEIHTEGDVSVK